MKNVILTIALVLLCAVLVVAQMDVTMLEREGFKAKNLTDEMANAASLCLDLERYGEGYIIFDYTKGNDLAKQVLMKTGKYDENYVSTGSYYSENAVIEMYYFDENEKIMHYTNGVFIDETNFEFEDNREIGDYLPEFEGNDYIVKFPCVACIYKAGKPKFHASYLGGAAKVTKKSIYEYKY